ncbi:MAG: serine protease [Bdellovibrionota bacterium]
MKKSMMGLAVLSVLSLPFSVSARDKIVGGEAVKDLAETPYMVSLSGACGGSIIAKKWILTAAHCAGYFREAKAGVLNLKDTGFTYKIKRTIKHPGYKSSTMENDFALAELETEIDFAATGLKAVKLANPEFERDGHQDPGLDSTVYGFGNIKEGQSNSAKALNKVIVPIVSRAEANADIAYKGEIDATMIAAGYATGGKDSCQGDSGGPLVVFDHANQPIQIGVVSWGEGCARANKYGIYSNVSSGHKWILDTMAAGK